MKNKFRIALLSMAAVGLVGCADKLTDEIVNQSPEDIGGETGYISFRIKSADTGGMTRAWLDDPDSEYEEGGHYSAGVEEKGEFAAEYEIVNNIQANRVFFFDENGTYHSSSLLNLAKKEDNSHNGDGEHTTDYPEKVYTATVKRTSDRGELKWPTQCLVVLNGRPSRLNALLALAQAGKPAEAGSGSFDMQEFLEWINKDFRDTDAAGEGLTLGLYKYTTGGVSKHYFTMTNSVFLGKDDEPINATQITEDNLKMTSELAQLNPITVYVERIMSKVEVGFSGYVDAVEGTLGYFDDDKNAEAAPEYGFFYEFDDHEEGSKWLGPEDEKVEPIKLKALVTNWTINAVEYQTKLFKDIDFEGNGDEAKWDDEIPFDGWNDISHHRSYWARDVNYEWKDTKYPTQYRKVFTGTAKPYQSDQDWAYGMDTAEDGGNDILNVDYPWALDYKAFSAVTTKRPYKYCLENTFEIPEGNDKVYKNMIMGSHVLVQARLLTGSVDAADETKTDKSEEAAIKEALENLSAEEKKNAKKVNEVLDGIIEDKYYYSDRYYDEENYIKRQIAVLNTALEENINFSVDNLQMWNIPGEGTEDQTRIDKNGKFTFKNILGGLWIKYTDDNGQEKYKRVVTEVGKNENGTPKDDCQIAATDVFTIAPAYTVKGDGKVTIALGTKTEGDDGSVTYHYDYDDNVLVNLYYFPYAGINEEDGQPVNEVTVKENDVEKTEKNDPVQFTRNQLVSLIYGMTNVADCYKHGMMYYAVPIQHFIAGTHKGEDGEPDGNYAMKYDDIVTGDYGVVRNHWYKFNISAIAKPGIPVHDPDQPIIPNYDDTDRYIGFEVVILPWHIVDNGNVTLGKE